MTFSQRIKMTRLARGWSQQKLANAMNALGDRYTVTRTSITQWESGKTKEISAIYLLKAAKVLQVMPEWLYFGTEAMCHKLYFGDELLFTTANMRSVPVLKDLTIKFVNHQCSVDTNKIGIDMKLAKTISDKSFAVTIQDESMSPILKPMDLVIVDPTIFPKPGEMVAAKLSDQDLIFIRKFRLSKDESTNLNNFELIAYNPDWPTFCVLNKKQGKILGTLVEHRCKRRLV